MPYVSQSARKVLDITYKPLTVGELTYTITKVVQDYLHSEGKACRFSDFAEAIAALECAKLEVYRIQVAAYEDIQRATNDPNNEVYGGMS